MGIVVGHGWSVNRTFALEINVCLQFSSSKPQLKGSATHEVEEKQQSPPLTWIAYLYLI